MPWTPMRYVDDIFNDLERSGYKKQVPKRRLIQGIRNWCGVYTEKTVSKIIRLFVEQDFLSSNASGTVFEIDYDAVKNRRGGV